MRPVGGSGEEADLCMAPWAVPQFLREPGFMSHSATHPAAGRSGMPRSTGGLSRRPAWGLATVPLQVPVVAV